MIMVSDSDMIGVEINYWFQNWSNEQKFPKFKNKIKYLIYFTRSMSILHFYNPYFNFLSFGSSEDYNRVDKSVIAYLFSFFSIAFFKSLSSSYILAAANPGINVLYFLICVYWVFSNIFLNSSSLTSTFKY